MIESMLFRWWWFRHFCENCQVFMILNQNNPGQLSQYHCCSCPSSLCRQVISKLGIDNQGYPCTSLFTNGKDFDRHLVFSYYFTFLYTMDIAHIPVSIWGSHNWWSGQYFSITTLCSYPSISELQAYHHLYLSTFCVHYRWVNARKT